MVRFIFSFHTYMIFFLFCHFRYSLSVFFAQKIYCVPGRLIRIETRTRLQPQLARHESIKRGRGETTQLGGRRMGQFLLPTLSRVPSAVARSFETKTFAARPRSRMAHLAQQRDLFVVPADLENVVGGANHECGRGPNLLEVHVRVRFRDGDG